MFQPLSQLHQLLTCNNLSQLAKDCLPYEGFERLFSHYGRLEQKRAIPLGNQSIATLKEYLLDNLDQPMRLEQLSQLCELSPTQFQRHFKAKVGLKSSTGHNDDSDDEKNPEKDVVSIMRMKYTLR